MFEQHLNLIYEEKSAPLGARKYNFPPYSIFGKYYRQTDQTTDQRTDSLVLRQKSRMWLREDASKEARGRIERSFLK